MGFLLLLAAGVGGYAVHDKMQKDRALVEAAQVAAQAAQAQLAAEQARTSRHPRVLMGYTVRRHRDAYYDRSGNYRRT